MSNKPNVIYILADDMGYGDISALNERCPWKTPHLDEMCVTGIAFTDAHSASSVCSPSRYSILTGRYSWRSQLKSGVLSAYSNALIEDNRTTVAHVFKQNGYRTAAIGKWHLGMDLPKDADFELMPDFETCPGVDYSSAIDKAPIVNGFDYFYGISGSLDMPPYMYIENDRFTFLPDHETENVGKKFWRRGPTAPDFKHEEVLPRLTGKVLQKIEEYKDEPFFIYFPMPAPHTPILPSEEFAGKSGTNEYGDFVLMCDDVVGQITAKLVELGLYDNTVVIYTSDNGCSPMADLEELRQYGHNPSYVFKGYKFDIYEGGHRMPFLIRWPEKIKGNHKCDRLICLSDFMATIADLLDTRLPDDAAEDSISNLPLWLDPSSDEVREDIIHQSVDGSLSIRRGHFKLAMCPGTGGGSWSALIDITEDGHDLQLFDLASDIGETTNICDKHPDIVQELRARLIAHIENGRSTPGIPQKNDGVPIWSAVRWLESI